MKTNEINSTNHDKYCVNCGSKKRNLTEPHCSKCKDKIKFSLAFNFASTSYSDSDKIRYSDNETMRRNFLAWRISKIEQGFNIGSITLLALSVLLTILVLLFTIVDIPLTLTGKDLAKGIQENHIGLYAFNLGLFLFSIATQFIKNKVISLMINRLL